MAAKTFAFALCLLAAARAQSSDAAVAVPVVAVESSSAVVVRAPRPPAPACARARAAHAARRARRGGVRLARARAQAEQTREGPEAAFAPAALQGLGSDVAPLIADATDAGVIMVRPGAAARPCGAGSARRSARQRKACDALAFCTPSGAASAEIWAPLQRLASGVACRAARRGERRRCAAFRPRFCSLSAALPLLGRL